MVMKMDMNKAYDRMEWTFLIRLLRAWGFNDQFEKMVYNCMNTVSFYLILNGNITKTFSPSRELH